MKKGNSLTVVASKTKMDSQQMEWQTESDLSALMRAEEIKKDPARMERVKVLAKKQLEEAATIVGATSGA